MKILVLGANGMAGHTIAIYFKERGYDVTAFTRTPFGYCKNIIGDALNTTEFKQILVSEEYTAIINCIGLLNEFANNNRSLAIYLNSFLPHLIADELRNYSTKLVQISTDCVFSGNTGPYFENSLRDGLTFYDRTKALGEVEDDKNVTFRNSMVGPDLNINGIGLLNWFMKQSGPISGYSEVMWTGVSTITLAKAIEKGISENIIGLYNLVNNMSISKYDLLSLFNIHLRNGTIPISKMITNKVDKSLRNNRMDFSFMIPTYEDMVIEIKEWILSHKNLYDPYIYRLTSER